LKALGIPQGPAYKWLLDAVRDVQLDGIVKTKEQAVAMVSRLLAERDDLPR